MDDLVLGEAHWQTPCITSHCAGSAAVASQKDAFSDQLSLYIVVRNCEIICTMSPIEAV